MSDWYRQEAEQVLQAQNTGNSGLSAAEAARRLAETGPNELIDRGGKSPWKILLEQLTGIMTIILIVAAVISLFLGDHEDAIAILAIVILNTILGFTQEYRAERAMAALKRMAVPHVRVRRDGQTVEITARELVPGDLALLEAGNVVPADGRLIEAANLRVQEAVLTGESEAVEKQTAALDQENLSLGDRRNTVYMGTVVTYGRGLVLITETGMRTELGRIAEMLQGVREEATPLQRRLEQLARGLAVAALAIVAVVFLLGVIRGEDMRLMFLTAISMAVAAVPEGLPTVVTIGLALGAQRMLGRKALIRKLPAVETLGSVTVICSDKTGTLTENRMTVTFLDVANHQLDLKETVKGLSPTIDPAADTPVQTEDAALKLLLVGSALCNDASLEPLKEDPQHLVTVGDPTEGALVTAAARAGLWKNQLESALPRLAELPFDSDRKRMTTVHGLEQAASVPSLQPLLAALGHPSPASYLAFTKGAADSLLEVSDFVYDQGQILPLDESWRARIREANNRLAQNGMRVLGLAARLRTHLNVNEPSDPLENELIFIGLAGMIDPARPEVKDAVRTARAAGIRPIMITGDHPLTALSIARELGIASETSDRVSTGADLARLSLDELANVVQEVSVFARVSPEHKLKIVQALQMRGQIVAMTGDGVNDAPALKKADIGVAMGITGTDVSKESAEMVLLDDNFATIVAAVEEGRHIYDNIRKFIKYALGSNISEILVMLIAPFLGMPLPLLPLQILWVNLVTDGLPGLALTMERSEKNTMRRKPYPPQDNIFAHGLGRDIAWIGLLLTALTLGIAYWAWSTGQAAWQTMAFTTLTLAQMGNVIALRSERESLFSLGILSNKAMLGSVLLTVVLQLAVIYVPFLGGFFETVPLSLEQLGICLLASLVMFGAIELEKWILNRRDRRA